MGRLAALLIRFSGIPAIVRATLARRGVGILLYHDPSAEAFDRHLRYLRRHYSLLPFARLVRALDEGDWAGVPRPALVLHFDDGYRGNVDLLEVCDRHGVTPTLFLCSHIAGTRRHYWSALKQGRAWEIRLMDHDLLLRKLREEAGFQPTAEHAEQQALSEDEIRTLAGRFDFQSHGRYHFSLLTLDDRTLEADLRESRARVEELTGRRCEHFAFPYGDHGARERQMVARCGYRTARTTGPGWVRPGTDRYRLPIVADVPGDASVDALRVHLTGLPRLVRRLGYLLVTRHVHAARRRVFARRRFF